MAACLGAIRYVESCVRIFGKQRGQIRRALPGAITDQMLMFEQKRFCGDGAYPNGISRDEFERKVLQQVDKKLALTQKFREKVAP